MPRAAKSKSIQASAAKAAHDPLALKILYDTYWSQKGWKLHPWNAPPPMPASSDFEYAKSRGIMFSHFAETRSETVSRVRRVAERTSIQSVADAFISSLETRRLELRSALGSFAAARHFPAHACSENSRRDAPHICSVCGLADVDGLHDRNVLNFERFKWGGVRHTDAEYIAHDLELFCSEDVIAPSPNAMQILRSVLGAIASARANAKPADLERAIAGLFPSNQSERRVLLEIFGICGVLEPKGKPSYRKRFIPDHAVPNPPGSKNDWAYPVAWWRGSDGVNRAAVREWFPALSEKM